MHRIVCSFRKTLSQPRLIEWGKSCNFGLIKKGRLPKPDWQFPSTLNNQHSTKHETDNKEKKVQITLLHTSSHVYIQKGPSALGTEVVFTNLLYTWRSFTTHVDKFVSFFDNLSHLCWHCLPNKENAEKTSAFLTTYSPLLLNGVCERPLVWNWWIPPQSKLWSKDRKTILANDLL